jgi:hypothetical protein
MRFAAVVMLVCSLAIAVGVFTRDWIRLDESNVSLGPIGGSECGYTNPSDCRGVDWDTMVGRGVSGMAEGLGIAVALGALIAACTGLACGVQLMRKLPAPLSPTAKLYSTMMLLTFFFAVAVVFAGKHVRFASQPVGWAGICTFVALFVGRATLTIMMRRQPKSSIPEYAPRVGG